MANGKPCRMTFFAGQGTGMMTNRLDRGGVDRSFGDDQIMECFIVLLQLHQWCTRCFDHGGMQVIHIDMRIGPSV